MKVKITLPNDNSYEIFIDKLNEIYFDNLRNEIIEMCNCGHNHIEIENKIPEATFDSENIVIKGAREHNLKNIDVEIPKNKFIVITGVSGSGKSSLAFDTIYSEGQRRYVESLSAYARQFIGQMTKNVPDVILFAKLVNYTSIIFAETIS